MLIQTKTATDKMFAAGFKRREFSVRAERRVRRDHGFRYVEWGDAHISVFVRPERVLALADRILAQGLGLQIWTQNGEATMVLIDNSYGMRGRKVTHRMEDLLKWEAEASNEIA